MPRTLTIGCTLPTSGDSAHPIARRGLVQAAEALGFDSIWLSDHIVVPDRIAPSYPYSPDCRFPTTALRRIAEQVRPAIGSMVVGQMLAPGLVGESSTTVDDSQLAIAVGSGGLAVFSTPSLIALMENAARAAVEPLLPADQTTVGIRVDVRHLAASPPGEPVRARADLVEVDGRRLVFHVEAFDSHEKIGEGTHERMVVDPARLLARAQAKRSG